MQVIIVVVCKYHFFRHIPGVKKKPASADRRSPCPIACSLDILGDRWTLLIVRDMILGAQRFKEFLSAPEGIPTNILTERLARLSSHGVIESTPAADGSRHPAYKLTSKGKALLPLLQAMRDWGLKWEEGTAALRRPTG